MKPLIILLISFFVSLFLVRWFSNEWNVQSSGNIAMFIMLCATGIIHFIHPKGMAMMMPDFLPFKQQLVYITGIMEFLLGLGLLFPAIRKESAIALMLFLVLVLAANIHASTRKVNFEKADYSGKGLSYLWFRIPLQLFFIGWTWYFGLSQ